MKNLVPESTNLEVTRKKKLATLRVINYAVATVMMLFAILYLDEKPSPAKYVVMSAGLFGLINAFITSYSKDFMLNVICTGVYFVIFCFGMVITGGYSSTGIFWAYLLPAVMFSIYGAQLGLWFSAASLIGLAFVMNYPAFEVVHYTSPQVSRFLITYSLMSAFLYIKEYFSEYGVQSLIKISNHHAKEANIDPLTGLPNRRFLDSIYFESARRSPFNYFPMSVAIVDLDSFKAVNDRLGHDVGDSVLQHTAKTLKQSLRNVDVVARTGGEEFLILLPKTEIKDAEKVIEKLRVVLHTSPMEDKSIMESLPSNLSFSAGIASVSSMDGMHDAIKAADKAMYKAKEHGRNRVEVADGEKI